MTDVHVSSGPDFIPDYEFDQLIAEAVRRVGRAAVSPILEQCADEYGWPIPPIRRGDTIRRIEVGAARRCGALMLP